MASSSPAVAICSRRFVPDGGGTERHTQRLATSLARRGMRVTVVTGRYKGRPKFEKADGVLIRRLFIGLYIPIVHEIFFQMSFFWYLLRYRREYDIIQLSHTQLSALVAVIVAGILGKSVVTRNGTAGERGNLASWASVPFGPSLLHFTLERVNAAVAVSSITRDEFLSAGVPTQKIWLIRNGVEIPDLAAGDLIHVRHRLEISPKTFVVVFAGRLSPIKAPGDLLDAWMLFSRQHTDTQLLFVGDGELVRDLQAQVAQSGLAERVRFLGKVDDISDYLLIADAFVLPSLSEAMPNALLEAMAVGLPVIASAVGGILDVVENGRNGLLFTPRDIDALAACLLEIAQSPELREMLGTNARQTIINEYDLEHMTDRYVALYRDLSA